MQLLRSLDGSVAQRPSVCSRRRLLALATGGGLGMVALTARLFQLQVLDGAEHRSLAENNRLRFTRVPASRGLIYDRSGIPMVRNMPSFTVSALPADLPRRPEVVLRRLAKLIGGSAQEYARLIARARSDPFTRVPLRTTTDPKTAHAIEERHLELPGILVEAEPVREYVDGPLTSHVVGHVGRITQEQLQAAGGPSGPHSPHDRIGQSGVEARFDGELRGAAGRKQIEVDATGREVSVVAMEPPVTGRNVQVTIDLAFQREVHRILAERIEQFEVASVVAVDPNTGQILALVHLPAYDNRLFAGSVSEEDFARLMGDPARPMLNGAVGSAWPPGSCFKIVTALAGLERGIVQPDTRVHCGGGIRLPNGASRKCWASHGEQDLVSALANSCDTYFYSVVGGDARGRWKGLGAAPLADWARQLGFGEPTGVQLPGEVAGNVPTPEWKAKTIGEPWYKGDDWLSAIGQGFYLATPIQMAMMAGAMANGGALHRPRLALAMTDARGRTVRQIEPRIALRISADPEHVRLVREGVRAGMLIGASPYGAQYTGTSHDSKIAELPIAGKTSTAEWGTPGPDGKLPTHGWFAFWAPHDQPRLAGAVFVKRGRGAQEAAKVGAAVIRAYFGIV